MGFFNSLQALCLLALWTLPQLAHAKSLTFCVSQEFRSLSSFARLKDKVCQAAQELNFECNIRFVPRERSIVMTSQGVCDGDFPRAEAIVNAYPHLLLVTTPLSSAKIVLLAKAATAKAPSWDELKDYRLVTTRGLKMVDEELKGKLGKGTLAHSSDTEAAMKMLLESRVDYAVLTEGLANEFVSKKDFSALKILSPPLFERKTYLVLNQNHAALVNSFAAYFAKKG